MVREFQGSDIGCQSAEMVEERFGFLYPGEKKDWLVAERNQCVVCGRVGFTIFHIREENRLRDVQLAAFACHIVRSDVRWAFCDDYHVSATDAGESVTHTPGRKQTFVPWVGGVVGEYYAAGGTDVAMLEGIVKYYKVNVATIFEVVNGLVTVTAHDNLHVREFAVNLVCLVAKVKACGRVGGNNHAVTFSAVTT